MQGIVSGIPGGSSMRAIGRVNVRCRVEYDVDGTVTPLVIYWPDGRKFTVELVSSRKTLEPLPGGRERVRYDCIIKGRRKQLYWDGVRWYVEGRIGTWH